MPSGLFGIIAIVPILLFVLAIAFVTAFTVLVFRLLTGGGKRRDAQRNDARRDEETQRLHADLVRMEKRIEALETILIEQSERK